MINIPKYKNVEKIRCRQVKISKGKNVETIYFESEDEGQSEGDGFWIIFCKFSKIVKQKNKILGFGAHCPPELSHSRGPVLSTFSPPNILTF